MNIRVLLLLKISLLFALDVVANIDFSNRFQELSMKAPTHFVGKDFFTIIAKTPPMHFVSYQKELDKALIAGSPFLLIEIFDDQLHSYKGLLISPTVLGKDSLRIKFKQIEKKQFDKISLLAKNALSTDVFLNLSEIFNISPIIPTYYYLVSFYGGQKIKTFAISNSDLLLADKNQLKNIPKCDERNISLENLKHLLNEIKQQSDFSGLDVFFSGKY